MQAAPTDLPFNLPQRWWILAACSLVAFAQLSEPHLWMIGWEVPASAFGAAWRDYRILVNLGTVLFVAFQLVGGVLGDLLGRRRIFLIGAIGATVANILSLLATDLVTLTVSRGLVGLMGALVFPLTLGMIRLIFDGEERTRALVIYTFATSLGTLASLLGIPFEYWFGWRWTLLLPIATGLAGTALAWRHLPESRAQGGIGRVEAITAAAWTLVFLAMTFGVVVARVFDDWLNPITIASGGVGLLGLAIMVAWTQHAAGSGLFKGVRYVPRGFLALLLLVSAVLVFGLSAYVLQLYSFFFNVQGFGAVVAGVAIAPVFLGNIFVLRWAARFALEQPTYQVVGAGLTAMGMAILLTALARPGVPYWLLVPPMMLFGVGFLVASTAWALFFFGALPSDLIGLSSGINRASGQVGAALSGVILGTIVELSGKAAFKSRLGELGLDEGQQALALQAVDEVLFRRISLDQVAQLPNGILALGIASFYRQAFSVGISSALVVAGAVCLACAVVAWLWLRGEARAAAASPLPGRSPIE